MATQLANDIAIAPPRIFRVRRVQHEIRDVMTLELDPSEGLPLLFDAGQFNMLYGFGAGEAAISISGSPLEPGPLVHTIRIAGATTRALCNLKRGQSLGVRGPFGVGWPMVAAEGHDLLLIAGGLGLAPLRPVIYQLIAQRERFGRICLLIGARSPDDILFAEEILKWRARLDLDVLVTVDSSSGGWRGEVGVVTTLIPRAHIDAAETVAMICGPEVMMRFCGQALREQGVPAEQIYVSMERNMKCAVGACGHCQYGPLFVCRDGPVFPLSRVERLIRIREV